MLYLANSNANSNNSLITSQDAVERAQQMKKDLLDKLEKLAEDLPPNTLDELIDELGGPENVAEVNKTLSGLCLFLVFFVFFFWSFPKSCRMSDISDIIMWLTFS